MSGWPWMDIPMVSQQLFLPMITAGDCGKGDELATAVCGWIGRNHHIQPVDDQTVAFFVCYQTNAAFSWDFPKPIPETVNN